MKSRVLSMLAIVAVFCCGVTQAQVPRKLNYQGFLTSPSGAPINSAALPLLFRLYDASNTLLYSETQSVTVSNGIFNVLIGSVTPLTLPFDAPYTLGITMGADPEMTPRQTLAASPYALRAASAESLAPTATVAGSQITGTVAAGQLPALTGDVITATGSAATTLAAVNATPGTFGDGTRVGQFTVNAKGLITAASNVTITGMAPSGLASGDLSGNYPGPTVAQVAGATAANVAAGTNLANAATNANTPSTIVKRDASGNFAAATITGNLTGNVAGNATTATRLTAARSINGVAFDGTADIVLPIYGAITGTFTQPAVNANTVPLVVSSSTWMTLGQVVYVATGGYYAVFSTPDATHVVLTNLGYAGNTAPSSTGNGGAVSPAGPTGANGIKSLVAMTTEPAGSNCAYGGTKVTSGLDLDSSGALDSGEVTATGYACNGTPYAVVPSIPPGCGTQPLSLGTPAYVSPAGLGGVVYKGDTVNFSVNVTDPNTCNSVTVANNYIWTLVSKPLGSTATLSSTTAATPALVADIAGGTYQLSVQVIDTLGNKSPTAFVNMNVSACGAQAPVISAVTAPSAVYTSTTGQLGLVASSPDNQNNGNPAGANFCPARFAKTLSFHWSITSAPAGSTAQLSSLVSASPIFSAGTAIGSYSVNVVVTDSAGLSSAPASTSIAVGLCGTAALTWPPSNAVSISASDPDPSSPSGQANVGTQVALTPAVTDPNVCAGAPVTQSYQWALLSTPNGSTAKVVADAAGVARFIPDLVGTYQFQVTASDSLGNTSPLYNTSVTTSTCGANPVSVSAKANVATLPVGTTSESPVNVNAGTTNGVGLVNGAASSVDNTSTCPARFATTFTYAWSIVNAPPGSTAQLTNVNGTTTNFVAGTTPGIYQLRVVATALNGQSSPPSYVFFKVN